MEAETFDAITGIGAYTTSTRGIGGRLRVNPEDFIVQEIGLDGSVAPLRYTDFSVRDQPGKFIAFFLVKRNIDTLQAIRRISKVLRVSYKRFSYAGIKDKRALTSQRVTFYRAAPHDLVGLEIPNIVILHPHRVSKPILPGAHSGNKFCITIRDLEVPARDARIQIEKIKAEFETRGGVLNFFGPQRFGVVTPTTHLIGKQIILGNLEEAINIVLNRTQSEEEIDPLAEDLRHIPHKSYERAVAQYLHQHPTDYHGCLRVLPKGLVRLYIHAFQSYLFNKAVSERAKRGLSMTQPTVGDFVMPISGEIFAVRTVRPDTLAQIEEKIREGQQQLVIPLIGYDFENFAFTGPMGEILSQLMAKEQITPKHFRLDHLPELSSRGSFRPICFKPQNLCYTIKESIEPTVTVAFDLPKGSYASVVLREFIKPHLVTQL